MLAFRLGPGPLKENWLFVLLKLRPPPRASAALLATVVVYGLKGLPRACALARLRTMLFVPSPTVTGPMNILAAESCMLGVLVVLTPLTTRPAPPGPAMMPLTFRSGEAPWASGARLSLTVNVCVLFNQMLPPRTAGSALFVPPT